MLYNLKVTESPFHDLSAELVKPKKQITLYCYKSKMLKSCWTAEIVTSRLLAKPNAKHFISEQVLCENTQR